MPARCEQCGNEVERLWEYQISESTDWLCQECHPRME
jgi:DNA-directed RNA polymerase subunit RPC12/RpoP